MAKGKFFDIGWHSEYKSAKKRDYQDTCIFLNNERECTNKDSKNYLSKCFDSTHCKLKEKEDKSKLKKDSLSNKCKYLNDFNECCNINSPTYLKKCNDYNNCIIMKKLHKNDLNENNKSQVKSENVIENCSTNTLPKVLNKPKLHYYHIISVLSNKEYKKTSHSNLYERRRITISVIDENGKYVGYIDNIACNYCKTNDKTYVGIGTIEYIERKIPIKYTNIKIIE